MTRLAVLISGQGTNLKALLDQVHGRDGIEVVCVASSRAEAPGLAHAAAADVETGVFEIDSYLSREERDADMADWLERREVDLVVLAGFMQLLSPDFIRRFDRRIINVHPSLLPAFPGVGTKSIEQALSHGVKLTGVTVHYVDEGVDSGPIILQEALELTYPSAIAEVVERLHEIEHRLLPQAVRLFAAGRLSVDPANPRLVLIDGEGDQ